MIRLHRPHSAPATLTSAKVRQFQKTLESRVTSGTRLTSADFRSYWGEKDVRATLYRMHHKKCCYCERIRDEIRETDVEHFRPKTEVHGVPKHPGYWWLAYTWDNLFFSCKCCNQTKNCHFPLINPRRRAFEPADPLTRCRPLLVHPCDEAPESLFAYEWTSSSGLYVKVCGIDEAGRGQRVIKLLDLNREELLEARAAILPALAALEMKMKHGLDRGNERIISKNAARIWNETSSAREFAGFRRYYFRTVDLGEYIADD